MADEKPLKNPRHKERHYARNGRDLFDIGLKAMDRVEQGKGFFESVLDAFTEVRGRREEEEKQHPVGPGLPIGFRPPRPAQDNAPIEVVATIMKNGLPYCAAHDVPMNMCTICKERAK